ncbi:MAG: ATP-binding protein, partial [Bacteroidales bacterium]
RSYLSTLLNNYAYQLMAENKYDSAGIVLKQAIVIARELHDNDLMSTIFDSYSDYYSNIGNYKMALIYKDSSIVQQDIYRNQQHIQESLFLSALFESEQKEKELFQKQIEINRLWVIALGFLTFFIGALGLGFYLKQKLSLSKSKLESVEKGKALELADALITGQDAERKRLAMDLHDGAIANMGALRFMVDGFFKNHEKYQVFVDSIMSVIRQLREVSHRMLPVGLHDHGLETTIQNLAESVNLSGKYQVSLNISLTSPLSEKMEINLYYLINELINNATKHSKGNAIYVQLMEHKKSLTLSVEDNGGGFDQTVSTDGLGLRNIKSRVEYLGGKIEIISDDSSTIFLIEIPI